MRATELSGMAQTSRPLAVVTGASTGIGYELAKCCAQEDFDLVLVTDEPEGPLPIRSLPGGFVDMACGLAIGSLVGCQMNQPPAP